MRYAPHLPHGVVSARAAKSLVAATAVVYVAAMLVAMVAS